MNSVFFCIQIYQAILLMDIWVISSLELLWIKFHIFFLILFLKNNDVKMLKIKS